MNQIETSYHGNPNLKAVGYQHDFTKEQLEEFVRCSEDPIYFIENYCKIVTLDRGLQAFKLYDCQKLKVDFIMNNRKTILMEGRQQGKTITSAACILHYTIFQDNITVKGVIPSHAKLKVFCQMLSILNSISILFNTAS